MSGATTTGHDFRRALAVTRLTRVAVTRVELEAGACGVAVPVFGPKETCWPPRSHSPTVTTLGSGGGVSVAAVGIHPTTGQELQLLSLRGVVAGCHRDDQLLPALHGKTTKSVRRPRRLDTIATWRHR